MICRYCRSTNSESEHRCQRCGRRLEARYANAPYAHAATAPKLEVRHAAAPAPSARSAPEFVATPGGATGPRPAPSWQPSLFGTRELGRVVSLNELSGKKVQRPRRGRAETLNRHRTRRSRPGQQALGFTDSNSSAARADAPGQIIWCDAPVAIAAHRIMAALLDLGMVALAVCLFLLITYGLTGSLLIGGHGLLVLGIATVLALFYKALWCLGNADTPGMYWAQLRTVNFDGLQPEREQRFSRLAAGCLSFFAIGLGLLWSLVDEEALTWHDHISRTFPTPFPQA